MTYPALARPPGRARGEGRAVVERLRLLDHPRDLRGVGRLRRRPAGASPSGSPGLGDCCRRASSPQPPPDAPATGQIYWYTVEGGGLDLGRLRGVQDWYVRPQLASRARRGRGGERRRLPDRVSGRRRSRAAASSRASRSRDVSRAVAGADSAVGGHVIQKGNAEYLVRGLGRLGDRTGDDDVRPDAGPSATSKRPRSSPRPAADRPRRRRRQRLAIGPGPRRGVLEKDGSEVVGGVVLMRRGREPAGGHAADQGQDPRARSRACPPGVRIVPFYDRTPLIRGAIGTVTGTIVEAIITAHRSASLLDPAARPRLVRDRAHAAAGGARRRSRSWGCSDGLGIADVQTNIMSLAGIAISIGVLVDSSIVMAENAMHRLRLHFGDRPGAGRRPRDRPAGLPAGRSADLLLGRDHAPVVPAGLRAGRDRGEDVPAAGVHQVVRAAGVGGVLAITLVPALCTIFLRGRMRGERESPLVRGVIDVYRPVLVVAARPPGAARLGPRGDVRGRPGAGRQSAAVPGDAVRGARRRRASPCRTWRGRAAGDGRAWSSSRSSPTQSITPLGREFLTPLDEGMVMDMPITVPRASVTRVGRRPEGARHDPLPVPRGRHGRRQGRPRRDADRPRADGHDRDHGQLPPPRILAAAQAARRATRRARPRRRSMPSSATA